MKNISERFGGKLGKKQNNRKIKEDMKMEYAENNIQMKTLLMLFILLVAGTITGIIVSIIGLGSLYEKVNHSEKIGEVWPSFSTNFTIETIIICINLALLIGLLYSYKKDFKKTKSPFLLGLILFFLVLLIQSLLSLPLLNLIIAVVTIGARQGFFYVLLGYQSAIFSIIAHFFETIALIILFYISMR